MRGHVLAAAVTVGVIVLGLWFLAPKAAAEGEELYQAPALEAIQADMKRYSLDAGTWEILEAGKGNLSNWYWKLKTQAPNVPLTAEARLMVQGLLAGLSVSFAEWDQCAAGYNTAVAGYQADYRLTVSYYNDGDYVNAWVGGTKVLPWDLGNMETQIKGATSAATSVQTALLSLQTLLNGGPP